MVEAGPARNSSKMIAKDVTPQASSTPLWVIPPPDLDREIPHGLDSSCSAVGSARPGWCPVTTNDVIDKLVDGARSVPEYAQIVARWGLGNAWWITLLAAVALVLTQVLRHLITRRLLKQGRLAFELLPTNGFDPGLEDVLRFAKGIAQAQRTVSRWAFTPARGTAMRVRLVSSGGPLSLRVEGPARAASVLRHQGYAQCELRAVDARANQTERPRIRLGVAA